MGAIVSKEGGKRRPSELKRELSQRWQAPAKIEHLSKPALELRFEIRSDVVLGKGSFAKVFEGYDHSEGVKLAIKVVDGKRMSQKDLNRLQEEIRILQLVSHPNIISLQACCFIEELSQYYLIMEHIEGGELFDQIILKTCYTEREAKNTAFLLLDVLSFLHDRDICHRDLKPENLLLKSRHNCADVKIADFGCAIQLRQEGMSLGIVGSPGYMAPEIILLKRSKDKFGVYGLECDMFSLGTLVYVLLGGYNPFSAHTDQEVLSKSLKGDWAFHPQFWSVISEEAKAFIRSLLCVDPSKRLTAAEALNHPWFKIDNEALKERDLQKNLKEMKSWNAQRKLKRAATAVMATIRIQSLLKIKSPLPRFVPDDGNPREFLRSTLSASSDLDEWESENNTEFMTPMEPRIQKG